VLVKELNTVSDVVEVVVPVVVPVLAVVLAVVLVVVLTVVEVNEPIDEFVPKKNGEISFLGRDERNPVVTSVDFVVAVVLVDALGVPNEYLVDSTGVTISEILVGTVAVVVANVIIGVGFPSVVESVEVLVPETVASFKLAPIGSVEGVGVALVPKEKTGLSPKDRASFFFSDGLGSWYSGESDFKRLYFFCRRGGSSGICSFSILVICLLNADVMGVVTALAKGTLN